MVKVREDHPTQSDGSVDIDVWIERLMSMAELEADARNPLRRACLFSELAEVEAIANKNVWAKNSSSFRTGLEMAEILADLKLDRDTLVASVLYRAVREGKSTLADIKRDFGAEIESLIKGVLSMAAISTQRNDSNDNVFGQQLQEQGDNVRKMLVSMVDDVRVALIKLAERTCAIRAVKNAGEEKRRHVAQEVADIYAPLAHRLGIGHIKWELEDLSFRYLETHDYMQIARLLDERRLDRQSYIENVIDTLRESLKFINIDADIFGRAKHIYSIWRKMRRKDIGFSQVYDIRAVRILVPTVRDCYSVLGTVHSLWRNIPNEFDDYIASPKENGYRSLHTAVIGPERKVLEVQIRTQAMHEEAEFGVCAHWMYKGTDKTAVEDAYEQKIAWLRQVLEWHDELGGNALEDDLAQSIEQERIYVFTPDGHVLDFSQGATVLDFAFRIHTDVGNSCRGAKVNGRIVPLNHRLKTSDRVEVLTGKRAAPSRDWLSPALGYITTSRARAKIQHWFKLQARDQNISDGQALLDREFKRLALLDLNFEDLAKKLNLRSMNDLYAAVGASDIGVGQVLNAAQKLLGVGQPEQARVPIKSKTTDNKPGRDVYIDGVGNLLTHFANCCTPVPGDAITGYITLGKGVSIHRQDCSNILQLQTDEPERMIKVDWGEAPENVYPVDLIIEAFDRQGLLRDVTALLDNEQISTSAMQTLSDKRKNTVDMLLTVEIRSFTQLSRVLARLNQLSNIASARRKH